MVRPKRRPPDLDHCIRVLLRLEDLSANQSLIGEIFVCGVGFLYHLKQDRRTIREICARCNGKASSVPYPKPNSIPAISAVVHNQDLFRALITSLSTTPAEMEASDSARANHQVASTSRKRTASLDGALGELHPPSKSIKISHSPHISKRMASSSGRLQMNFKLMAATMLFVAFEHLDHWPAAFVRAYAEDSFGPRAWVDEVACRFFVQNLALVHEMETGQGEEIAANAPLSRDALTVAKFYEQYDQSTAISNGNGPSSFATKRRGSLSSSGSGGSAPILSIAQRPRSMSTDSMGDTSAISAPSSLMRTNSFDAQGHDESSDSGEEEEVVALATAPPLNSALDDGESSSSGEEDEEVVISAKGLSGDDANSDRSSPASKGSERPATLQKSYPIEQQELKFDQIRQRYFGSNHDRAHRAIAGALQLRMDAKSKQNSGLLQTLPAFAGIPDVRRLITANLEKWLQSPALAGLARSLFAHTVTRFKNVDPPLLADLFSIDNVISMKLKANQLNAHVENISSIAKQMPTPAVSRHIYNRILLEALRSHGSASSLSSDYLKMVHAVHNAFPESMSAEGIAAAFIGFICERPEQVVDVNNSPFIGRICGLLRFVVDELGPTFNGLELLRNLARIPFPSQVGFAKELETDRARVLFQCMLLCINNPEQLKDEIDENGSDPSLKSQKLEAMQKVLYEGRKIILQWFCGDFARRCNDDDTDAQLRSEIVGAGSPDYSSILDGRNLDVTSDWQMILRTLLFLDPPDSPLSISFFSEVDGKIFGDGSLTRARLCHDIGCNVDDEIIRIVIRASHTKGSLSPMVAIGVLEHLFYGCVKEKRAVLLVRDPLLLSEIYELVQYVPPQRRYNIANGSSGNSESQGEAKMDIDRDEVGVSCSDNDCIPRLAYPGLWWRATALALVMCGASPASIGQHAWSSYPTLKTLIKMVTSDRYRFPTVDCDDSGREQMKKAEQQMRDEEANITENLFLPPTTSIQPHAGERLKEKISYGGPRASRRQQEKREKQLKRQREKAAQEAQREANRRRKLLRVAQKSIMLWDPKRGPRKPPKESADLIFSVSDSFDLAREFRCATEPDFLLETIGNTTRGAIERAYDWLIPIISFVPETIVRLPASASCFLLLRAYGTEGEERAQLQELSSPLLAHVRDSLTGVFGEMDSVRAFDLLLSDIASHTADRRRCARRVLHDAIGKEDHDIPAPFSKSNCGWMLNILNLKFASSVMPGAIRHLSRAASFERGRVLRFLILALEKLTEVANSQRLIENFRFSLTLVHLISNRPTVFASTMGTFFDLRCLAIKLVESEFQIQVLRTVNEDTVRMNSVAVDQTATCQIQLCRGPRNSALDGPIMVKLPISLLESACVLLSIWNADTDDNGIESLVRMLMRLDDDGSNCYSGDATQEIGLASATVLSTGRPAMPVESWVMLARSKSDVIAKRAALSAPSSFLPRLLLCSGLPRTSLLSMIDRLGQLGEGSADLEKTYSQLMVPSAASEWDIGRLGKRKEVSRKLLGRLRAYAQMHKLSNLKEGEKISTTFLTWLSSTQVGERSRRQKAKKEKSVVSTQHVASLESCDAILDIVNAEAVESSEGMAMKVKTDSLGINEFLADCQAHMTAIQSCDCTNLENLEICFNQVVAAEQGDVLDEWLERYVNDLLVQRIESTKASSLRLALGCMLLEHFNHLERKTESFGATLVKWVPTLSITVGSPKLWSLLLAKGQKPRFLWSNLISRCAQTWSRSHMTAYREWILLQKDFQSFDIEKSIRLILHSVPWANTHVDGLIEPPLSEMDKSWGYTEDYVRAAVEMSIVALFASAIDETFLSQAVSRSELPDAMVLLLLLAGFGRKQVQLVSQILVQSLVSVDEHTRRILLAAILRMYSCFPQNVNLGIAALRSALKEAVVLFSPEWLVWRSPLDEALEDLIFGVVENGSTSRALQALLEESKKHPLLIMKKLPSMVQHLEQDATARDTELGSDQRNLIFGKALTSVSAKINNKIVRITVRHWGFNYTEFMWLAFFDVVASVHKEVLFDCGFELGLGDFLGIYLRLFSVQTQLRTSERLSRLTAKLAAFLVAFKATNSSGWGRWMREEVSGLDSLGSVRNVLLSCDLISHEEAVVSARE